jgi:hypothetical protein
MEHALAMEQKKTSPKGEILDIKEILEKYKYEELGLY